MTNYQTAWPIYRALGWTGTVPLRPGTKLPPPVGFTGNEGREPSADECAAFEHSRYRGTTQLALRMPDIVIGTDIDGYDGRTGLLTMAEGARRWDALPDGPWSSARADGSGIRFFRVPASAVIVSDIKFAELNLGHVEVIRRVHRYAVVWPSIHPKTGTLYTWRGTAGPDVPPAVEDLPELPAAWLAGLDATPPKAVRAAHRPACQPWRARRDRREDPRRPGRREEHDVELGAYRLFQRVRDGQLTTAAAEGMLLDAGTAIHLPSAEIRATVASARRGVLGGG